MKAKRILFMTMMAALMLVCFAWSADGTEAAVFKETIKVLDPGQTYDISKAGINTQVTIDKSGEYWLTGKSSYVYVRVRGGKNVTIHLMNGLNIDTGPGSNVGRGCPGIMINEFDGTVTLSTCAGSYSECSGYWGWPAICKNGKKTKLIFDTEDGDNYGHMRCDCSYTTANKPCGIGAQHGGSYTCGNIEFNGGKWSAYGNEAAGIGASAGNSVDGLTINGGIIYCSHPYGDKSHAAGPGIGVNEGGMLDNLVINGGKITAYGECATGEPHYVAGAGIGGGSNGHVGKITINGGNIYAKGGQETRDGGSGIGLGNISAKGSISCDSIVINGGTVKAESGTGIAEKNAAIGSKSVGCITINGGDITATGGRAACAIQAQNVHINGGVIKATGGEAYAPSGVTYYNGHGICANYGVKIAGGMVTATRKTKNNNNYGIRSGSLEITGGYVKSDRNSAGAVNNSDVSVKETVFNLKNHDGSLLKDTAVTSLKAEKLGYEYGLKDVAVDGDGKLYFYVPEESRLTRAGTEDKAYFGEVPGGAVTDDDAHDVFLAEAKTVDVYDARHQERNIGTAAVYLGATELQDIDVSLPDKHTTDGFYYEENLNLLLAYGSGKFVHNVYGKGRQVTDGDGKWCDSQIYDEESPQIYCELRPEEYNIHFDPNRPKAASTEMKGSMDDMKKVKFGESVELAANAYVLPGYEMTGWNTKADGKGTAYADKASVSDLASKDGETVNLYAQWQPRTYKVTYDPGEGSGQQVTGEDFTFDKKYSLTSFADLGMTAPEGSKFAGWTTRGIGSRYFSDGCSGTNFCFVDQNDGTISGYTLFANYIGEGHAVVAVTKDHEPVSGLASEVELKDGDSTISGFTEMEMQGSSDGPNGSGIYYKTGVPQGTYDVHVGDYDTEGVKMEVAQGGGGHVTLDYFTINVIGDEGLKTEMDGEDVSEKLLLSGRKLRISAAPEADDSGIVFDSWTITRGSNSGLAHDEAVQEITAEDQLGLLAEARPAAYTVTFDPNVPAGCSSELKGSMEPLALETGETVQLKENAYSLKGYIFEGWNTSTDGTGTAIEDGSTVKDLTKTDGMDITLYAQWRPAQYRVVFEGNGADNSISEEEALAKAQLMTYDEAATLAKNFYVRKGYDYTGWNTLMSGKGDAYKDRQSVKNITDEDGAIIILYAQWKEIPVKKKPVMFAQAKAYKKKANVKWTKVKGADRYKVYFARCGHDLKMIKTLKGSRTSFTKKRLNKKGKYKFKIVAQQKVRYIKNGKAAYKYKMICKSKLIHTVMKGNRKFTNPKKVTVKKNKVILSEEQTFKIKAKVKKERKKAKLVDKEHGAKIRYTSTDKTIAKVSKKGVITAVGWGECDVYAQAINGKRTKVHVTVE